MNRAAKALAGLLVLTAAGQSAAESAGAPEAEFHMMRLKYVSNQGQRAWRPWC